jgi:hypothetical protein
MKIDWSNSKTCISFALIYPLLSGTMVYVVFDALEKRQLLTSVPNLWPWNVILLCVVPGAGVLVKYLVQNKWRRPMAALMALLYCGVVLMLVNWFQLAVVCNIVGGACH